MSQALNPFQNVFQDDSSIVLRKFVDVVIYSGNLSVIHSSDQAIILGQPVPSNSTFLTDRFTGVEV